MCQRRSSSIGSRDSPCRPGPGLSRHEGLTSTAPESPATTPAPPSPFCSGYTGRRYVLIVVGVLSQASWVIASIDGTSMIPMESHVNRP